MPDASDMFPFEYAGGGWFRAKGVPKGEKAEIIHGEDAVRLAMDAAAAAEREACCAALCRWCREGKPIEIAAFEAGRPWHRINERDGATCDAWPIRTNERTR